MILEGENMLFLDLQDGEVLYFFVIVFCRGHNI